MPTVAERLRQAREAQNLTVHQVAELTKIRTDHIRALEDGHYNIFSAPVYIRGFVRNYASVLKLDVVEIMAAVDAELAQTEKFREPPSLLGQRRGALDLLMFQLSKLNWRVVLPAVLGAAILLLGVWAIRGWRARHRTDPLSKLGPGLYQSPQTNSGVLLPLPTNAPLR